MSDEKPTREQLKEASEVIRNAAQQEQLFMALIRCGYGPEELITVIPLRCYGRPYVCQRPKEMKG